MNNKIWSQIKAKGNNHGVNLLLLSGITLGSLLLSPQSSYAAPFKLTQTFLNPTANSDSFGGAVAISGNHILIGANTAGSGSGAAYLLDGVTGNFLKTFSNPTPEIGDRFGISVAVSGNNILVGVLNDNTGASSSGAAYLFDAVTGNLKQTFLNPTPENQDFFGWSVSISGNNVLIGAYNDNTGAANSGAAYLFDGITGNLIKTFLNPTPAVSDAFGFSLSINGNNILIGANYDDTGAMDSGAAYLFDATTGNLIKTFLNPTPANLDRFGYSVSISDNNVLIGSPLKDDTGATDSGAAYLFDATTGNLIKTFLNPTPGVRDFFGTSVSISTNNILIGAYADDAGATGGEASLFDSGAAHLFDGVTGNLLQTFINPTPSLGDSFGYSVAINGNNALVGAVGDDTRATDAGAAYLFQPTQSSKTVPEPSNIFGLGLLGLGLAAAKMKGILSKKAKSPTDDHQEPDS